MSKKKNRQNKLEKYFDIRIYWKYAYCDSDEIDDSNFDYWFDTKEYIMHDNEYITDNNIDLTEKRYVKFIKINFDEYRKDLLSIINNQQVTNWFNLSKDKEDFLYRYRVFVDWNCLGDFENYRAYLTIRPFVIKWCMQNNIEYKNYEISAPEKYPYDDKNTLKNLTWELPDDNYLY